MTAEDPPRRVDWTKVVKFIPYFGLITALVAALIAQAAQNAPEANAAIVALIATSVAALWVHFISAEHALAGALRRLERWQAEASERLGSLPSPRVVLQARDWATFRDNYPHVDQVALDRLVKKYVEQGTDEAGDEAPTRIDMPVNFMRAVSDNKDAQELADLLCCVLLARCQDLGQEFDFSFIAAPLTGNTPIIYQAALNLRKRLILVDPQTNILGRQSIFGEYRRGERGIFVHDVIFTGKRIRDCVQVLRTHGLDIRHVACLLERTDHEPTASTLLARHNITLHSARQMNEADITNLGTAGS